MLFRRYKLTLLAAGMLFGFLGKLVHLLDHNGDIYAIYLLALLSGLAGCLLFLAFFMDKRDYQEEIAREKNIAMRLTISAGVRLNTKTLLKSSANAEVIIKMILIR